MENKQINITGINNKYQIKKLKKEPIIAKLRVESIKWDISDEYFLYNNQLKMIHQIQKNNLQSIEPSNEEILFIQQINTKINGYKNQDNIKKIVDTTKFINIHTILQKMVECELKCYFCKCEILVLYKLAREMKQWSVDRIDNDLGHNNDNFIITCLECNLQRKNRKPDKFLFTKQLNIIKAN